MDLLQEIEIKKNIAKILNILKIKTTAPVSTEIRRKKKLRLKIQIDRDIKKIERNRKKKYSFD